MNIELDEPFSGGQQHFVASHSVKLLPGFMYKPLSEIDYFKGEIEPFEVIPPDEGTIGGPIAGDDGHVGALTAGNSVGDNGSFSYTIEVDLPPGRGGMTPELHLTYNSGVPDGLLGIGWSISSLSSISHTSLTYHHDGDQGFHGGDFMAGALMLDGVRLIPNGFSEYRKEFDDFTKIQKVYTGSWYYFKVTTKSGLIYEYGRDMSSVHRCISSNPPGYIQIFAYYLSRVSDNYGNQIFYNYTTNQNTGEIYLESLQYLNNKIEFEYELTGDESIAYFSYMLGLKGALTIQNSKVLKKILIKQKDQLLWEYLLDYEQRVVLSDSDNIVRILKSIQKVIVSGEKYNSTKFIWDEPVEYGKSTPVSYGINITPNTNNNNIYYGKFFGNSSTDLIISTKSNNYQLLSVYKNTNGQFLPFGDVYGHISIKNGSVIVGDFNGDGFDDFVHYEYRDRLWYFFSYINNGKGNFTRYEVLPYGTPGDPPRDIIPGDFNGDGLADIMFRTEPAGKLHFLLGDQNNYNGHLSIGMYSPGKYIDLKLSLSPGHFTGSNRNEFFARGYIEPNKWEQTIYTLKKTGEKYELVKIEIGNTANLKGKDLSFADLNGDGKTDFIDFNCTKEGSALQLKVELFHTYGSDVITLGVHNIKLFDEYSANYDGHFVSDKLNGDFNGDGRTDAIVEVIVNYKYEVYDPFTGEWYYYFDHKSYLVYLYTVKSGGDVSPTIIEGSLRNSSIAIDLSGNGAHDICVSFFRGTSPGNYQAHSSDRYKIRKVVDGIGNWIKIDYSTTADQSVYLGPKGNYLYPNAASTVTFPIVASVTTSNGLGGSIKTSYNYCGAVINLQGLGLLGFKEVTSWNHGFDILSVTLSELQDDYSIIMPTIKTKSIKSSGLLISKTKFSFSIIQSTDKKTYFIAQKEILEEQYDADGSYLPYKSSKTMFKEYDLFGNPLIIINETGTGGYTFSVETRKTTINSYYNYVDDNTWVLGRLFMAETTFEYNDEPPITKKVSFNYYDKGKDFGMLKDEIIEPDGSLRQQKSYSYDDYGNILSSVSCAIGHEDRVSSSVYDPDPQQNNSIFATSQINALGHTMHFEYEYATGNLVSSLCANNNLTRYEYNTFGNLTKTVSPDGNQLVSVLRWVQEGDKYAPVNATYYIWEKSSSTAPTITYLNSRGDELRSIKYNLNGTLVFIDKFYNGLRQLVMQSAPYFEGDLVYYQKFEYDILGRLRKTITPHQLGDAVTVNSYTGLKTSVTNPNGQTVEKEYNSAGWLVSTKDADNIPMYNCYYSDGKLKEKFVNGAAKSKRSYEYDERGNLIKYEDMSQGVLSYIYNGYGDLIEETNAMGLKTVYKSYDNLGRPLVIEAPEGTKIFTYDVEKLGTIDKIESPVHKVEYSYDDLLRIIRVSEKVDEESFLTFSEYDHYGRPLVLTLPENCIIQYHYNEFGYNTKISDKQSGKVIWEGMLSNAHDQLTKVKLGNNVIQSISYWNENGRVKSQHVENVQDNYYTWDKIGNLALRKTRNGINQEFVYDALNRLIRVYHDKKEHLEIKYDFLGNIVYKSDVGNYFYDDNDNPYKLTGIDNVPNTIDPNHQEILYTSFNKVKEISAKDPTTGVINRKLEIVYGVNNDRIKQEYEEDGLNKTQIFINNTFEKEISNGKITRKYFISSPSGLVAIKYVSDDGNEMHYVVNDHLGSVQAIVSDKNELIEEYSYDPWGLKRDPISLETYGYSSVPPTQTDRGFTGHHQIDAFMLINMSGRMFDPVLGRFLNPDPYLQFPNYSQGLNPYAYTLNNPLRFNDPSGYSINDNQGFAFYQGVGSAMTTIVLMGAGLTPAGLVAVFVLTALNITTVSMAKGSPTKDAVMKGLTAGALTVVTAVGSARIGDFFQPIGKNLKRGQLLLKEIARAGAHGTMNGTIRWAQGGRFMHGFSSGFVSSLGGSFMQSHGDKMSAGTQIAMSAVIGGTAEALGGGKFANGAVTGAYVMMLNHMAHPPQTRPSKSPLNNNQVEALQSKINNVTFSHRSSWSRYDGATMDSAPIWEVSMDIEGVEPGSIYTAENVEIWLGKETLNVDIDYFPNSVGSVTNRIDMPRGLDLSPNGRLWFYTKGVVRGEILHINFHSREDYNKYLNFIKAHDLRKN